MDFSFSDEYCESFLGVIKDPRKFLKEGKLAMMSCILWILTLRTMITFIVCGLVYCLVILMYRGASIYWLWGNRVVVALLFTFFDLTWCHSRLWT